MPNPETATGNWTGPLAIEPHDEGQGQGGT